MSKRIDLLAAAVLAVGGIGFLASPSIAQQAGDQQQQQAQPSAQQPAEAGQAGQSAAGQQPGESAAQPGESAAQSGAEQAGATMHGEHQKVSKTLSETVSAALSGDASKLSDQFDQADQSKIKEIKLDQVDQSVQQLKQAYKDKYQKDLDLSQDARQVFNRQFAQISSGEQARQASAQIGAESGANAAGSAEQQQQQQAQQQQQQPGATAGESGATPGAGANAGATAGEGAQAAAGQQPLTVTIPASHGMPAAQIDMTRQQGELKLQLPPGADAQQIQQKLQTQLQQCVSMKDQWPSDATDAQRAIAHSVLLAFGTESATGATPGAAGESATPGSQTPESQTPGSATPGSQTPGSQTPGGQTPGSQTPGSATPGQ